MAEIICPLCGKPNPDDLDECKYCQAPLKTGGFIAPPESDDELSKLFVSPPKEDKTESKSSVAPFSPEGLEEAIPDWLKETEASFLEPAEPKPSESKPEELTSDEISAQIDALISPTSSPEDMPEKKVDDEWLASLLSEAEVTDTGANEDAGEQTEKQPQEQLYEEPSEEVQDGAGFAIEEPEEETLPPAVPADKPAWLTSLEAASTIKLEGGITQSEPGPQEPVAEEPAEESEPEPAAPPEWLTKSMPEGTPSTPQETEGDLSPAELPGWLEALRPAEPMEPSRPVEDVSSADIVTAGPLIGLRGVISPHPSAIRASKPPTYSIKLRVTDEQKARVELMEAMLADEEKPTPLPSQPVISSQNIFRLVIGLALFLPIIWMIITGSQKTAQPQSGSIPGVVDFSQEIQKLPSGAPVLVAFDYEAGFSGELNIAISNVLTQLINKNSYLTLVSTSPSGPALGESMIDSVYTDLVGSDQTYTNYADLGYIPGGTMGLRGFAASPKDVMPYSLNGYDVWVVPPLNAVSSIQDFNAVIVFTNDADTARVWIEQVGTLMRQADRPLLFVASSQAEPLIMPYYLGVPEQVQGIISGLAGGTAYANSVGSLQQNGVWDAYSIGITVSIIIIIVGSIASGVVKTLPSGSKKKEN
jgi:hypothetical protein